MHGSGQKSQAGAASSGDFVNVARASFIKDADGALGNGVGHVVFMAALRGGNQVPGEIDRAVGQAGQKGVPVVQPGAEFDAEQGGKQDAQPFRVAGKNAVVIDERFCGQQGAVGQGSVLRLEGLDGRFFRFRDARNVFIARDVNRPGRGIFRNGVTRPDEYKRQDSRE